MGDDPRTALKSGAETPEDYQAIAKDVLIGLFSNVDPIKLADKLAEILGLVIYILFGTASKVLGPSIARIAEGVVESKNESGQAIHGLISAAVKDLLGIELPSGSGGTPGGAPVGSAIMQHFAGRAGELQPGADAAAQFLGDGIKRSMDGWYNSLFFELITALIPVVDPVQAFAELDKVVADATGLRRSTSKVLSTLVDASVITPFEWHVNKTYLPKLLGAGDAVRQFLRGQWTRDQLDEELGRQGYNHDRIEALIVAGQKMFSVDDLSFLLRHELISMVEAVRTMREQGYDEQTASKTLIIDHLKQLDTIARTLATDAVSAYVARQIGGAELAGALDEGIPNTDERRAMREIADARRALNVKALTSGEARAAVRAGILASIDYRRALEREGRDPEAIDVLDLMLRHERDEQKQIEDLKAEQARERDAEKIAAEQARTAAKAAADATRALARRGREADLERAVVRGRIPIARYVEVLSAQFDADTVAIMVDAVEQARQDYLAEQQKKADAEKRAATRRLDVGAVRAAVLAGILTLDEFRRHPSVTALDAGDAEILTRTLAAELADRQLAKERQADAEFRAQTKGLDLARYAELVRRGLRTLDDYRARVADLGYGPADVDAIVELLELQLADDAHARETRAAAERQAQTKGLSLEQIRRAVLAGAAPLATFESFLIAQNYTDEARRTLVAELERQLADVETARAREQQAGAPSGAVELSLSELQRAARLGVISPADYRARLAERGYDELDAEIAVEILLSEIATTQQARALRDQTEQTPKGIELSLAELARAVKAGIKSLDDYRAALVAAGKTDDAVKTLVALLEDETAERKDAETRRKRIGERLAAAGVDLDALDRAVLDGAATIDDYSQALADAGVQSGEIGILVGLLVARLTPAG